MFKRTIVEKTYMISISVDLMKEILERDKKEKISLCEKIEGLEEVLRVNYDGHFGPYIFVTISVGEESKSTWQLVEKYINGDYNGR